MRLACRLLISLACIAGGAPSTAGAASESRHSARASPPRQIVFDFEDGDLSAFIPRPIDRGFIRYDVTGESPMGSGRCLRIQASGWQPVETNEAVALHIRLDPPIPIDDSTEMSWRWWISDRRENDGICLSPWIDYRNGSGTPLPFASHSNRDRGPISLGDPQQETTLHRVNLYETLHARHPDQPSPPAGSVINRIDLYLWFPYEQLAYLDDLRIGPPSIHPPMPAPVKQTRSIPEITDFLLADLDADGGPDQFIGQSDEAPLLVFADEHGEPRRRSGAEVGLTGAISAESAVAADWDADGVLDLAMFSGDSLMVFRGLGHGYFRPEASPVLPPPGDHSPFKILAADVLPPSGPELLVFRVSTLTRDHLFSWSPGWRWTDHGFPQPISMIPESGSRYRSAVLPAELDGDGRIDLFCSNDDLYVNSDRGLVHAGGYLPRHGTHQGGAAFGDVDNDGDLDLFIAVDIGTHRGEPYTTDTQCLLYVNEGGRFVDASDRLVDGSSAHAKSPLFEDFDLDGDLDLFFVQDHRWEPPQAATNTRGNLYFENDGTGHFYRRNAPLWIVETPAARRAWSYDADRDGKPDLVLKQWADDQIITIGNRFIPARPAIVVRVLDRRGAPHGGGARIMLRDASGRIAAFRETGAGCVYGGLGEAILGCASDGPFELSVEFPSRPGEPVVRTALHPGANITLAEPVAGGAAGAHVTMAIIHWRRLVHRAADAIWPFAFLALIVGTIAGWSLVAFARGVPHSPLLPPSLRAPLAGLVVIAVLPGAFALPVWPGEPRAALARLLTIVLLLGSFAVGVAAAALERSRRLALGTKPDRVTAARLELLDALDGLTHSRFLVYLGQVGNLARGLTRGDDEPLVLARLNERLTTYGPVIRPQLLSLVRALPEAELDPGLTHDFANDLRNIDAAIQALRESGPIGTASPRLAAIGASAERLHDHLTSLYQELGATFRVSVCELLRLAASRARDERDHLEVALDLPPLLSPAFGTAGDLANVFENLFTNASRAALANAPHRAPRVRATAREEAGLIVIHVSDTGGGIPKELWEAILEPRSGADHGGRGLPYARRRLHKIDGRIYVNQSSSEGTTMVVTLRALRRRDHEDGR